jgi:hypothetical protein
MLDLTHTRPGDDIATGVVVGGVGYGNALANPEWFDLLQLTLSEQIFLGAAFVGTIMGLIGIGKAFYQAYQWFRNKLK